MAVVLGTSCPHKHVLQQIGTCTFSHSGSPQKKTNLSKHWSHVGVQAASMNRSCSMFTHRLNWRHARSTQAYYTCHVRWDVNSSRSRLTLTQIHPAYVNLNLASKSSCISGNPLNPLARREHRPLTLGARNRLHIHSSIWRVVVIHSFRLFRKHFTAARS